MAEENGYKLEKVTKEVAGKGKSTVYTLSEKQSNAFGVQWTQIDFFDHEGDARVAFNNKAN